MADEGSGGPTTYSSCMRARLGPLAIIVIINEGDRCLAKILKNVTRNIHAKSFGYIAAKKGF